VIGKVLHHVLGFIGRQLYSKMVQPGSLGNSDVVGLDVEFAIIAFYQQQFNGVVSAVNRNERLFTGRPAGRLEPQYRLVEFKEFPGQASSG